MSDKPKMNKWIPTTDLKVLRRVGKAQEELNELGCVLARVIIQGIDEIDPGSGKVNRQRLQDEIADVYTQLQLMESQFELDSYAITDRCVEKRRQMDEWEALFDE